MRRTTLAAALLLAALCYPALAQSPADHEDHHQGSDQVQPPEPTTPPGGRGGMRGGMMGPDMMGHDDDVTGRDDMMGGGPMGRGMMGHGMMGRGMMSQGMMGQGGPMAGARGPSFMFRMVFALMDADGDGTVSLSEFQAAHERIFRAMDTNKDGKLTMEEMQAFMRGGRSGTPQQ